MPAPDDLTSSTPAARALPEVLELAKQLYREYYARCFWHCPRDLEITEELLPLVVKGLRTHGGRRGFILASKLLPGGAAQLPRDP
ncbi:MAG: hypothetical protein K2R98_16450 [Gemmataceae bacterium]|nr:hypothetical protein [Gemmataceae bacterium]